MKKNGWLGRKVLITVEGAEVAPRFDLTTEVLLGRLDASDAFGEEKTVVLPQASPEELCHMILAQDVEAVVCGGIEDEYYQYLTWKKVTVIDSVMAPWARAVQALRDGDLRPGAVLFDRPVQEG
jgi:hypothetical protein